MLRLMFQKAKSEKQKMPVHKIGRLKQIWNNTGEIS